MSSRLLAALPRRRPTTLYRWSRASSNLPSSLAPMSNPTHPSQPTPPQPARPNSTTPNPSTELFDILTATGHPTGHTKPRPLVHSDGDWHRSVHVWLVRTGAAVGAAVGRYEVLVQLRAACKDSWAGYWDVGCAGHLSAGETSGVAARAELAEELGVAVDDVVDQPASGSGLQRGRLQYLDSVRQEVVSQQGRFIDREWVDVYVLCGDYDTERMKLQAEEVETVRYVDVDEYVELLAKGTEGYVPFADLADYKRRVFDVIKRKLQEVSDGHTSQ